MDASAQHICKAHLQICQCGVFAIFDIGLIIEGTISNIQFPTTKDRTVFTKLFKQNTLARQTHGICGREHPGP